MIVLASCDEAYWKKYSNVFCGSLNKINQQYHVEKVYESEYDDAKVYYACKRYLMLPEMIEEHGSVFVADIDICFTNPIPEPKTKIGFVKTSPKLHRMPWEQRGMHVMAGFFYCSDIDIANNIVKNINELPKKWFVDQIAIHEAIKDVKERTYFKKPPTKQNQLTNEDFALVPRGPNKTILQSPTLKNYFL